MKTILFFALFFLSATAFCQTDSSKLYSFGIGGSATTPIRANDWEKLNPLTCSGQEQYEDLLELLQSKYKPSAPTGTATLSLDSVRNDVLVSVYAYLANMPNGLSGTWSNRIMAALKATPTSTYVINKCNLIDAGWNNQQTIYGVDGKRRYQKQRN